MSIEYLGLDFPQISLPDIFVAAAAGTAINVTKRKAYADVRISAPRSGDLAVFPGLPK